MIKEITIHNFRNLENFEAKFDDAKVFLITGDNEQGKSTILNAITMMLTGERDSSLLKHGEKNGFINMKVGEFEEYEIELRFSEKNERGTFKITAPNKMTSNSQSMLNDLFEFKSFDANEFINWSNTVPGRRKQVELVKSLLPKSVQDELINLDNDIQKYKQDQTEVNAQLKAFAAVEEVPQPIIDRYTKKKDVSEIYTKKQNILLHNEKVNQAQERKKEIEKQISDCEDRTTEIQEGYTEKIKEMKDQIERLKENIKATESEREEKIKARQHQFDDLVKIDEKGAKWLSENKIIEIGEEIETELKEAEEHNQKVDEVLKDLEKWNEKEELTAKKQNIVEKIKFFETSKKELISNSNLPVKGLEFTEDGLTLNGVPFQRGVISTSQEMEVAFALMIELNPTTKVFQISQGESLGAQKLKTICEIAQKRGYQGFIEEVKRGQEDLRIEEYTVN